MVKDNVLAVAPLAATDIAAAIRSVCDELNETIASLTKKSGSADHHHKIKWWVYSSAPTPSNTSSSISAVGNQNNYAQNLYSVAATKREEETADGGQSISSSTALAATQSQQLVTFYLAYSTWDGRVLFRDITTASTDKTKDHDEVFHDNQDAFLHWYHVLAKIAVALGCTRLVWHQHSNEVPTLTSLAKVETLHGWLTLHWSLEAMKEYTTAKSQITNQPRDKDTEAHGSFKDTVRQAFESNFNEQSSDYPFALRLATSSEEDIGHMTRLIQGLADYEKEPNAVHIGAKQLKVDGFPADKNDPESMGSGNHMLLYYCVLLEARTTPARNCDKDNKAPGAATCGMAFCYIGHHLGTGRFLYLEDLFLEEKHRGKGGGTLVMGALARVAQSLGCSKMVWQALDWNTPALNFYDKIGAKVQEGLQTCRITGTTLHEFAKPTPASPLDS